MKIAGGDLVVDALKKEGIKQIYGLIGYYVSPIFNACAKRDIKIYDTRHEQAAIHMAEGYTLATGRTSVAVVTGGPGFANSVSAIIKAAKGYTPMVIITGGFEPYKKDVGGLEDMNPLALVKDYIKWCATVYDTKRIPEYIEMAFRYAECGSRGPVVLEIPINYLLQEVEQCEVSPYEGLRTDAKIYGDYEKIEAAISLLCTAKRPIIIVGNDVFYTNAQEYLLNFVEYTSIPVFTVNAGRGTISDLHELCLGSGRTIEGGSQLYAYKNADVIMVIGSSLDYSLSFGKEPIFNKAQKIIQVDIDPCEIGFSSRKIDIGIVGSADIVLRQLLLQAFDMKLFGSNKFSGWVKEIKNKKQMLIKEIHQCNEEKGKADPVRIIDVINQQISKDFIVVVDGSNAMLWGCLLFKCMEIGNFIIGPNSTYGQMGAGLPLALGAKSAHPEKTVILYTGDGSLGFNLAEIHTAIRLELNVIIIVHNDSAWGFCKETQKITFGNDNSDVGTKLGMVRYEKVVESFGGDGFYVESSQEFENCFEVALNSGKLTCINVATDGRMSPGSNFINGTVKE